MISSTPVRFSMVRIFLPSRPIILPFISSPGISTTEIAISLTWSAAKRWIARERMSRALVSASSLNLSSYSAILSAVSCCISESRRRTSSALASSLVRPAIFSSIASCPCKVLFTSSRVLSASASFSARVASFFSSFSSLASRVSSF